MADAQNERTNGRNRRRRPRRRRGSKPVENEIQQPISESVPTAVADPITEPIVTPKTAGIPDVPVIRPDNLAPPTVRSEEYCVHHMASYSEDVPMETRSNMTTLRHLRVDHFGEATLFCDCLHNGPHEWPPSMQQLETAIELDQFLADSTNEA